eukprot:13131721-Alexandrium_andersonii.AAC.1
MSACATTDHCPRVVTLRAPRILAACHERRRTITVVAGIDSLNHGVAGNARRSAMRFEPEPNH